MLFRERGGGGGGAGGGSEVGETAESGVGTLKKKMFTVDST